MNSTVPSFSDLFRVTKDALLQGGRIVHRGFYGSRQVRYKTPVSPVTQVDVAAEKKIISIIRRRFPTHGFLAEEMSDRESDRVASTKSQNYRWIIDPLDGTVNFIHHIPQSSVSIAVERNGVVLVGGVYDPHRQELFMAVKGKGATRNGAKIRVSSEKRLINSLVITGFPYDRTVHAFKYLNLLKPFLKKCADLRRFGSAAIDLAWVACGRAEAYLEYKLSPWDLAAGSLLVEEAGGRVSDFKNKRINIDNPLETFSSNGKVHRSLLRILKEHY